MKEYVTTCAIDASPETVWAILTDADGYAEWNPEIIGIAGPIMSGGRITARVRLGDGAVRSVTMRVTTLEAPTRMEWIGGMPLGLFIGRRTFTVTPNAHGSEFRLHLRMSGALSSHHQIGRRPPAGNRQLRRRAQGSRRAEIGSTMRSGEGALGLSKST